MPIDSSIALGVQPLKIESPVNQLANVLQIQGAQQANQMNAMKMQQAQAGQDRQNKLYSVLGGLPQGASNDDRINALRNNGFLDEADKVEAGIGNRRKIESEATVKDTEAENKIIGVYRDLAGIAKDPATAAEYVKAMHSDPRLQNTAIARVPLEHALAQIGQDSDSFNAWKQQFGLGAAKFIEANKPTQTVLNNGGTNQVIQTPGMGGAPQTVMSAPITESANNIADNARASAEGAANRAVQVRGQNLTDSRTRDQIKAGKTQIVQSDNGPVLVDMTTGSGKTVLGPDGQPLPGVSKNLNDSQSKALLFGSRMKAANDIFDQLASEGTTTSVPGSRAPIIGGLITSLSPENRQMLDQAKRDFMTAVLRRESGAAISTGEYDTADKQYFPQIGDSAKVIAQKKANRELAMRGVLVEVPEKQRNSLDKPATNAPANVPLVNAQGWKLHTDANGNRAYVGPNNQIQEVR